MFSIQEKATLLLLMGVMLKITRFWGLKKLIAKSGQKSSLLSIIAGFLSVAIALVR